MFKRYITINVLWEEAKFDDICKIVLLKLDSHMNGSLK